MSAEFFLKTLGVPRLETAAGSEIRIRVRKHLAVLIVLAVEGGKVRRDRLVGMLWPTSRPDRARGSLATAISFLRGKLGGDAIEPGRDFVELTPGLVGLDLERLEKGEIIGDDFTPLLEVDAFLNGFELESLPEFEAWRDRHHARLLPSIEKGLLGLTDHCRRSGDISGLARYADRMLQLNDLSEWGIKARMEACALSGDRITALRVYDDWVERLKSELDARPARFVEELAYRLRRPTWDLQPPKPTAPPVRTEQWRDSLFVGRSKEYRELYAAWESARRGESRVLLLTGDSGIGKTTLADRLATALALEGASVARVRCYELERAIPYAMIGGVIEALLDRPGAAATDPEALAELGRLLPTVRRLFAHLPQPPEISREPARIRFANASLEFITSLMDEQPVIIVVDDFDQSDDTSLALLHVLIRRLRSAPVLVILTARTGHLARNSVAALRADASALGLGTLTLEPLLAEDSETLFDALLTGASTLPNTSERRAILSAAGGFPLLLELLLKDWQRSGMRASPLAVRAMTGDVEVNDDDFWHRHLAEGLCTDFSDPERLVIYFASILDRRVGDLALYAASGVPHATILGTLSRMVDQRLLRDGPHGLEWINPTVRAQSYLLIPKSLRKLFHEAIASELLRQAAAGDSIPKLEIAWHCMRAGREAEASSFLLSGARQAIIQGAPHEAELALTSGMQAFGHANQEATLVLAEAMLELNRPSDAINLLTQCAFSGSGSRTADLLMLQARDMLCTISEDERTGVVKQVCHIISSGSDPSTCVLALATGADALAVFGHNQLAEALLEASTLIDHTALDPANLMKLRLTQSRLEYIPRRLDRAWRLLLEAEELAETHSIRYRTYLQLLNGFGAIAAARGEYEDALTASRKHFDESSKADDDLRAAIAGSNAAIFSCRLGRYKEAVDWARRSKGFRKAPLYCQYIADEYGGIAHAMLGDKEGALQAVGSIACLIHGSETDYIRRRMELATADVLMVVGDQRKAIEYASTALSVPFEVTADLGIVGTISRWLALLAETGNEHDQVAKDIRRAMRVPLDAIDRVECLAALVTLELATSEDRILLKEGLRRLPVATSHQLARLGLRVGVADWVETSSNAQTTRQALTLR